MDRLTRIGIAAIAACVLWAASASAQTPPAAQGPLVLQPSNDGPVIAPEVKWANFDKGGSDGTLVGGYGGWVFDNRLLLGGGVSFLVDHGRRDRVAEMGYGGFVAGWTVPVGRALSVGLRGLVGLGRADLTDTVTYTLTDRNHPFDPDPRSGSMSPGSQVTTGSSVTAQFRYRDDFFVFEPQATALVRIARGVAVEVSGGYRVISGAGRYDDWLRGASGSLAVRIGPKL